MLSFTFIHIKTVMIYIFDRMLTEKSVEALAETEAEYTILVKKFNMISFTRPEETGNLLTREHI
jgi:hypothetical protein